MISASGSRTHSEFRLQRGDGLHGVGGADRLRAGFRQAKCFTLPAWISSFTCGTSSIARRIDAVLVEQVDDIDLSRLSEASATSLDVHGRLSRPSIRRRSADLKPISWR